MTREKEIDYKKMANTCEGYYSCAFCPYCTEDISRFIGDKWVGGCPDYDRKLVYALGQGYRKIPDGAVVLTREEYYDLKNKVKWVKELGASADKIRRETAREICDFAENEIKKLGKETTTDSFGERPLLFYEAAGKLIRSIKEKFEVE